MEGLIKCPQCNRKYKQESVLKNHLHQVHQEQEVDAIDVVSFERVAPRKRDASLAKRKARVGMGGVKRPHRVVPKKRKDTPDEAHQLRLETERKCASIIERARTNPDECSICMSAPAGSGAVIPCGHSTFCYACLKEWGQDKGCPMCRGKAELIQELRI